MAADTARFESHLDRMRFEVPGGPVILLLAALVAVGSAFRIALMSDSIAMDELSTYFVVQYDLRGMIKQILGPQEWTPPLYFLLAWLGSKLGGDPWLLRLPSLLAGIATIPLTYLLGVQTVGRRAAVFGTAVVAFSPLMIAFSTEARAYALTCLIVLCSTIVLVMAVRRPTIGKWLLYALLLAGAMYSHYTASFVLLGQSLWAFVAFPQARRWLLLSIITAAVLWLPWLPGYLADATDPAVDVIGLSHPFGPVAAGQDLIQAILGSGTLPARPPNLPGPVPVALFGIGLAIAVISLVVSGRSGVRGLGRFEILVVVLALSAPVGAVASSLIGPDTFLPRTLLPSVPGFALALGVLVCRIRRTVAIPAAACLLAAFVLASLSSLSSANRRSDMGSVVGFIESHGTRLDPVVDCSAPSGAGPWQSLGLELGREEISRGRPPLLRLCMPSFRSMLEVRQLGAPGQFALDWEANTAEPEDVAKRAVELARDRRVFLVIMGETRERPRTDPVSRVGRFLRALPAGYEIGDRATYESINGLGPTVFEIVLPEKKGGR